MDSLDKNLIELLARDARQSSEALAKQLNVSPATIRRRINKLIQSGVVRIVAVGDPNKIGFPLAAVICFDVAHEKLDSVMEMLANRREVRWVSSSTGRFDIIALARFHSTDELSDFMQKEMAHVEGLRNSETFVCLHVKKGRYVPLDAIFGIRH